MTRICFVDCETTSLDPEHGEIWEVGLIVREPVDVESEHQWFLPVGLDHADPIALGIGRFHQRHPDGNDSTAQWEGSSPWDAVESFATAFAHLTHGAHLVGNVVSFDEKRLERLLRCQGVMPSWHHHIIDCEALVAGRLGLEPPWDSMALSAAIGVEPPTDAELHTGPGDARWSMRLYDAVMGGGA
jgi:hypothetical protein